MIICIFKLCSLFLAFYFTNSSHTGMLLGMLLQSPQTGIAPHTQLAPPLFSSIGGFQTDNVFFYFFWLCCGSWNLCSLFRLCVTQKAFDVLYGSHVFFCYQKMMWIIFIRLRFAFKPFIDTENYLVMKIFLLNIFYTFFQSFFIEIRDVILLKDST